MLPRHLELHVFSYVIETHKLLLVGNSRTGKSTLVRRCLRDAESKYVRWQRMGKDCTVVAFPFYLTCNKVVVKELGGLGKYKPHPLADLAHATRILIVVKNGAYVVDLFDDVLWFMKRYKSLQKPFTIVINMRSLDDKITEDDYAKLSMFQTLGVRHIVVPSLDDFARPADIRRLLYVSA